jgi:glucose-1-phosphate thymidylyltransferase
MKAVIPVAGAGTRLRPHTYTQPKPLLPVGGKPIIAFIIDRLVDIGIQEFVFVIGYLGEKIKNFVEERYPNIKKEFIYQEKREGLGHAIWTAREALSDTDEIFIVLGDTIFETDLSVFLKESHSCLGVKRVNDPREFGVVEVGKDGNITRVVEKPKIPKSNLAIVGLYKIKEVNALLEALNFNIQNNMRSAGEFQLADGLQRMIEQGAQIKTLTVNNWFDCGRKEVLLETNAMLLDKEDYANTDILCDFDDSIIVHPVHIGENCVITNSIVGPHVTVGSNTTIVNSIIRESIIGSYSNLEEVVLSYSVIGSDAAIKGIRQSLNIGDNTEIDFGAR